MVNWSRSGLILILVLSLFFGLPAMASAADLPIHAKSAVLMEAQTGEIVYEHNPDEELPMASVTKIMTLVLALEALRDGKVSLDDVVVGSYLAKSMGGTQIWLEEGEQMSLKDMLYAIGVGSANDCAVAVGEYLGGSFDAFVDLMNAKAKELGMEHTHYANPTGLDASEHYSSARDLAILSRYALSIPMFSELTSTWEYWVRKGTPQEVWLTSFNKLLKQYPGYDGIKTGYTSTAGYCLSSSAKRNGIRLIAISLGSKTRQERDQTIKTLLDYGFGLFKAEQLLTQGEELGQAQVLHGLADSVGLVAANDLVYPVRKGSGVQLTKELDLPETIKAPITLGQKVGLVTFKDAEGEVVVTADVLASSEVKKAGFIKIISQTTRELLKSLFFRS